MVKNNKTKNPHLVGVIIGIISMVIGLALVGTGLAILNKKMGVALGLVIGGCILLIAGALVVITAKKNIKKWEQTHR